MASTSYNAEIHRQNKLLYKALMETDKNEVKRLCEGLPEGPFRVVDMHNDTVLHIAAYTKQNQLVLDLLGIVSESENHKLLTHKNDEGNTVLHEAATTEKLIPAAREIVRRAPDSQRVRNKLQEAPILVAARYGKYHMFDFLDKGLNNVGASHEEIREFHRRSGYDEATILHLTVATDSFELAYEIANRYEYLAWERDGDGMTALQLLAYKPSAFYSSSKHGRVKRFIYKYNPGCRAPLCESIRMEKQKYESALQLAKYLIAKDVSWEVTQSSANRIGIKFHNNWKAPYNTCKNEEGRKSEEAGEPEKKVTDTPLLLATKRGCAEMVEEILDLYPQAVGYVDDKGRNILHVAIKYRQIHILDLTEKMQVPVMRKLVRKIDNDGNTILHMVGIKEESQIKDLRNPTLQLQENLLLFERVKNLCAGDHYAAMVNKNGETAEEVFVKNNEQLHRQAKDWLRRTAENCSIISVLIVTVAFAAAYTLPGGSDDNTGYPVLLNQPFFIIFTIADVLSITFALTSVITFLSILTSPFQLTHFHRSLPQALMLGVTLLIVSVSMMMLALAATIILIVNDKREWTKIALYSVAFLPVSIFIASYLRLYAALWKALEESVLWDIFPRFWKDPAVSSTNTQTSSKDEVTRFNTSSTTPLDEPRCPV